MLCIDLLLSVRVNKKILKDISKIEVHRIKRSMRKFEN